MVCAALVAVPAASESHTNRAIQCERALGGKTYASLIRRAYALRKWEKRDPRTHTQRHRIERHRGCARSERAKRYMLRASRRHRERFQAYREQRLAEAAVTPYDCGSAGRFAIPCYIVACESGVGQRRQPFRW